MHDAIETIEEAIENVRQHALHNLCVACELLVADGEMSVEQILVSLESAGWQFWSDNRLTEIERAMTFSETFGDFVVDEISVYRRIPAHLLEVQFTDFGEPDHDDLVAVEAAEIRNDPDYWSRS